MSLLRVYTDTSVIGGCYDVEFALESKRLIGMAKRGLLRLLVSEVVLLELEEAPDRVKRVLSELPQKAVETVRIDAEIVELADAYIAAGVITPEWRDDALHVAAATVARADAIVSWNFKHIVRLDKMKAYNQVNLSKGYGILTIVTPEEVLTDENERQEI